MTKEDVYKEFLKITEKVFKEDINNLQFKYLQEFVNHTDDPVKIGALEWFFEVTAGISQYLDFEVNDYRKYINGIILIIVASNEFKLPKDERLKQVGEEIKKSIKK